MNAEEATAIENGERLQKGKKEDNDQHEKVEVEMPTSLTNTIERDSNPVEMEINNGNDLKENGNGTTLAQERKPAFTTISARKARCQTLVRSFFAVDYTQAALIPGMRTSIIIMLFWIIFGIGNSKSTSFQLGALYVGLTDPNGNLSRRLHSMGLTLISVVLVGTAIPYGAYASVAGTICVAFAVAFFTGCSPLLGDPALVLALKLGTALFAIHGAVHRNTSGSYEDFASTTLLTLIGGSCSLGAALLPEIIGNRDAVRTDLFKLWHGFGRNLGRWSASWGTGHHTSRALVPHVTVSLSLTMDRIQQDETEDPKAKQWLLKIMNHANTLRTSSLCLSNMTSNKRGDEETRILDDLFQALACTVKDVGFAFQFPWCVRFVPFIRHWVLARADHFEKTTKAVISYVETCDHNMGNEQRDMLLNCMPSLVNLLQSQVQASVDMVLDGKQWPPYSSPCTLPRRIRAAFPKKIPSIQKDPGWAIRGYAIRFATAFTFSILPEMLMTNRTTSAHWFPMTVALIMGPSYAATSEKVFHRTIGTLLGIALGSAISPLFQFPGLLILLLGLNTYAVCVFFTANYAMFTVFITSWVFCTTVGVGRPMGITILYRILWTLAAAALVLAVSYTYPPRTEFHLTAKLAEFARVTRVFAETVVEEHRLVQSNDDNGDDDNHVLLVKAAAQRVKEAQKVAARTRMALFTYMHDAVLTPTEGYRIDPHSVAPQVASDLIDAVVIPLFLSLIKDGSADSLLSDLEDGMKELERLIQRLEAQAALPPGRPDALQQPTDATISSSSSGKGPFSRAVANAHQLLDEAGVPVGSSSSSRILENTEYFASTANLDN